VEPVSRVALPLEPVPDTADDMRFTLPEPAEMPTPDDTVMPPPSPVEEVLAPAEMTIEPPPPMSEEPT